MWWAAINVTPEDVLEYLSFIGARFDSWTNDVKCYDGVGRAFDFIDGVDGNGVVSLREFEEAYREMECTKFKEKDEQKREHPAGADEKKRIEGVFRYLDPSGEGTVSKKEWSMLDMLQKEINLSITEFVQFCERTFGDDLETTWKYFDVDNDGSINGKEWLDGCEKIGYFGPVVPIFGYIDADDEGTVSVEEFKTLSEFQESPENRFHARQQRIQEQLGERKKMFDQFKRSMIRQGLKKSSVASIAPESSEM